MAQPLLQRVDKGGGVDGAAGNPLVEYQLGIRGLPGGLRLGIGALLHRLGYGLRRAGDGHRHRAGLGARQSGEIPDAPGEEAARLRLQSLLHRGVHVHGDGGIVGGHGVGIPAAGELRTVGGQLPGQGLVHGGLRRLRGHASHVHMGDGGVGQEDAAARGSAQAQIGRGQRQDHDQYDNEGDAALPPLAGALGHPLTVQLFHIDQLQTCRGVLDRCPAEKCFVAPIIGPVSGKCNYRTVTLSAAESTLQAAGFAV